MARRGRRGWLPKSLVDEAEDIMQEENIQTRSAALDSMVKHAKVGRELHRLTHYNPLGSDWKKKRRKKK